MADMAKLRSYVEESKDESPKDEETTEEVPEGEMIDAHGLHLYETAIERPYDSRKTLAERYQAFCELVRMEVERARK